MTKQEFIKETRESADIAVQRANAYLERLGLSLTVNWDYDAWKSNGLEEALGAYESDSVFSGEISIAFNMRNLRKWLATAEKDNPWSDTYTMLDEAIQTNVFHEMGHGIVQLIDDYLQNTDELDDIYDRNQELFDDVLDNEEDAVEEFAWDAYDNQPEESRLGQLVDLYVSLWDTDGQGDDDRIPEIVGEEIRRLTK